VPYLSPDALPTTDFIYRRLAIPNNIEIIAAVNGALDELTKPRNWEDYGSINAQQIAAAMDTMFRLYLKGEANLIGSLILYATGTAPNGTLLCDGSAYLRTDYPQLYAVLASPYIVDANHFTTPSPASLTGLNYYIVAR